MPPPGAPQGPTKSTQGALLSPSGIRISALQHSPAQPCPSSGAARPWGEPGQPQPCSGQGAHVRWGSLLLQLGLKGRGWARLCEHEAALLSLATVKPLGSVKVTSLHADSPVLGKLQGGNTWCWGSPAAEGRVQRLRDGFNFTHCQDSHISMPYSRPTPA